MINLISISKLAILLLTTFFLILCTTKKDDPSPVSTGNASFWIQSDLGYGNITVYVDNKYAGQITHYHSTGINCGSADVNVTKTPGTYTWTASCTDGTSWSGTVTITSNGCFSQQLTGNGTTGNTTGKVSFWTQSDLGHGTITIYVNSIYAGQITHYNSGGISCGSADVNVSKAAGTYSWNASATDGTTWSGTVTITANGCFSEQLTGTSSGNNCYTLTGSWTRTNDGGCPNSTGMIVNFSNGQGVIQYVPSSNTCGFYTGQVKWKNSNSTNCTIDDLNLPSNTYKNYNLTFIDNKTFQLGSVTYSKN